MSLRLYTFLLYLLMPLMPLKLLWRAKKQPEYLLHWRERYGFYALPPTNPVIWLHCVSVGETRAAEPLIKQLLQHYPDHQILLSHTTPTGRATGEQLFGDSVMRVYLPYDLPFAVSRFLKHFNPVLGVLMETELWFNLIKQCNQQNVPLLLINARLSEKSARGYEKLGRLAQQGLGYLSAIAAQTEQDATRLKQLGATHVHINGNLKFDVSPPEDARHLGEQLRNQLGNDRPIFLAASTRDGEEAMILEAVKNANIPHLITIIVPRHPQRFEEVADLLEKQDAPFIRRSSLAHIEKPTHDAKIEVAYMLGDSMGEMFAYYAMCDIAFIGGSLLPLGGQNLIEACAMGKPVLIGPHTFNFEQVSHQAIDVGAAERVEDIAGLSKSLQTLFTDLNKRKAMSAASMQFSNASRGATERTLRLLEQYLPKTPDA